MSIIYFAQMTILLIVAIVGLLIAHDAHGGTFGKWGGS